jgi:hypothetical protein
MPSQFETDRRPRLAIWPEGTFANIAVQGLMVCVVSSCMSTTPTRPPTLSWQRWQNCYTSARDTYAHSDATMYDFGDNEDLSLAAFCTLLFDGINILYSPDWKRP